MPNAITPKRTRALGWMILGNLALGIGKGIAGVIGHSSALLADAMESFADVIWSLVSLFAIRIAHRPPDKGHPYGHGKAEPLVAMVAALGLMGSTLWLAHYIWAHLFLPSIKQPAGFTIFVLIGVLFIKAAQYQYAKRIAHQTKSVTFKAEAAHHFSDAITSFAALIGLLCVRYGPAYMAKSDQIAALMAIVVVVYHLGKLLWATFQELMDEHPSNPDIDAAMRDLPSWLPVSTLVEQYRVRKMGVHYYIDLHLHVPEDLSVREGHALAHKAKDKIRERCPMVADVLIHVEPFEG